MGGTTQHLWPYWQYNLIYVPFVFAFGAIVGSFLNVVIYRLPAGQNIISPPSHCPVCTTPLRWNENLPIVGWLWLRGRCAHCGTPISIQYPLIETIVAVLFTAMFVLAYLVRPTMPFVGELMPAYFRPDDLPATIPMLGLYWLLLSSLLAMTVIDLRTFTIPIQLALWVTIPAMMVHAVMPIWPAGTLRTPLTSLPPGVSGVDLGEWMIPLVGAPALGAGLGAQIGIGISTILLRANVLRFSFLDFDLWVKPEDEIIDYPHPRRELEWEIDFLAPVILGLVLGWRLGLAWGTGLPLWAGALGGSIMGYLVGAGLVWIVRLLFTLLRGREAIGLGDAHLLGAVGAVLGWIDPILVFFLAPVLALTALTVGAVLRVRAMERFVQYGPWLAAATLLVILGKPWIEVFLEFVFGGVWGGAINLP